MEVFVGNNHRECPYDARNPLGDHIIRGAIHKTNQHLFDDSVNPIVMQANVFGARAVLMSVHECDGCLVMGEEGGCLQVTKSRSPKIPKMRLRSHSASLPPLTASRNVLALSGRKEDDFLSF